MRINRFFVTDSLQTEEYVVGDTSLVHQLRDVLKMDLGDEVILFNSNGEQARAQVLGFEKKTIRLAIVEQLPLPKTAERPVTLYVALVKHANFEWIVEKATELGVTKIIPLITDHTIKQSFNTSRVEKIIIEATEQSGRVRLPELGKPLTLSQALQASREAVKIFFNFTKEHCSSVDFGKATSAALFIGPEGGWSEREAAMGAELCTVRSLGDFTLRAETAAIAASYLATQL